MRSFQSRNSTSQLYISVLLVNKHFKMEASPHFGRFSSLARRPLCIVPFFSALIRSLNGDRVFIEWESYGCFSKSRKYFSDKKARSHRLQWTTCCCLRAEREGIPNELSPLFCVENTHARVTWYSVKCLSYCDSFFFHKVHDSSYRFNRFFNV